MRKTPKKHPINFREQEYYPFVANSKHSKIKQLILHLRLWKWAAVHSPDFKAFEISYSKIFRVVFNRLPYVGMPILTIEIQIYKPHLYLFEPSAIVSDFCRINKVEWIDLYPEHPF